MRLVWVACLLFTCLGCAPRDDKARDVPIAARPPTQSETPEKSLFEQVRSGHYQLQTALEPLETATIAAKELAEGQDDPDTRKAVLAMQKEISQAGSAIADYTEDPPAFDEFTKQFAQQDDDRLKAIDGCTKAIGLLKNAGTAVDDMLSSGPPDEESKKLNSIKAAVDNAQSIVDDAMKTLGGKED